MTDAMKQATNFYQPEVVRKLQISGAFLVKAQPAYPEPYALLSPEGRLLLRGEWAWINKVCHAHGIPTTELPYQLEDRGLNGLLNQAAMECVHEMLPYVQKELSD